MIFRLKYHKLLCFVFRIISRPLRNAAELMLDRAEYHLNAWGDCINELKERAREGYRE